MAIIVVMEVGDVRVKVDEPFPWMDDARSFAETMAKKVPTAKFEVVERKDGNPAEDLLIQPFEGALFGRAKMATVWLERYGYEDKRTEEDLKNPKPRYRVKRTQNATRPVVGDVVLEPDAQELIDQGYTVNIA